MIIKDTEQLTPGTWVQHFKGGRYVIEGRAVYTEDTKLLIIYLDPNTGTKWARPDHMFLGQVRRNGVEQPRFTIIDPPQNQ